FMAFPFFVIGSRRLSSLFLGAFSRRSLQTGASRNIWKMQSLQKRTTIRLFLGKHACSLSRQGESDPAEAEMFHSCCGDGRLFPRSWFCTYLGVRCITRRLEAKVVFRASFQVHFSGFLPEGLLIEHKGWT